MTRRYPLISKMIPEERGQAMVFLLLALGAIMAFAAGLYITSALLVTKIKAQNAADAAALAGAGALADSLDAIALGNIARGGSWLAFHWGKPLRDVANMTAAAAIEGGASLSTARAAQIGLANGAIVTPTHTPDLEVREIKFLDHVLAYRDKLKGRIGKRFMRVTAIASPQVPKWIASPLKISYPLGIMPFVTTSAEAIVLGRGLVLPKFRGALAKVPARN